MNSDRKYFYNSLIPGLVLIIALWFILFADELMSLGLWRYGVKPREVSGLKGIAFMPFIHGGWKHLVSNSLPLFFLLGMLFNFYKKVAWEALFWMFLMTGLWTWVIARSGSVHIGASGIVYALVTFLFFSGLLRRDKTSMVISLVVTFLYGSLIWGVLPIWKENISWEGHLSGAISGVVIAYFYRRVDKVVRLRVDEDLTRQEALYGPEYWKNNNDSKEHVIIQYHYKPTKKKDQDSEESSES